MRRLTPLRRFAVAGLAAGAIALAAASPAFAHNEVTASDSRALATDVTLTFGAEAESTTAGIASIRVVLPEGITPADVTYVSGPAAWTFQPGADGFTVGGTPLAAGTDAEFKVKVRQLPSATSLMFKTLQTYSDGRIDRWIDPPAAGGDHHSDTAAKPAPILTLQKAAPGATPLPPAAPPSPTPSVSASAPAANSPTPAAPTTPPPAAAAPSPTPSATVAVDTKKDDDSSALPLTLGIIAAVLVLGGAGAWWWRRRNSGTSQAS